MLPLIQLANLRLQYMTAFSRFVMGALLMLLHIGKAASFALALCVRCNIALTAGNP
jgi:hypothetical protein